LAVLGFPWRANCGGTGVPTNTCPAAPVHIAATTITEAIPNTLRAMAPSSPAIQRKLVTPAGK
jgi:hypothetical protein